MKWILVITQLYSTTGISTQTTGITSQKQEFNSQAGCERAAAAIQGSKIRMSYSAIIDSRAFCFETDIPVRSEDRQ